MANYCTELRPRAITSASWPRRSRQATSVVSTSMLFSQATAGMPVTDAVRKPQHARQLEVNLFSDVRKVPLTRIFPTSEKILTCYRPDLVPKGRAAARLATPQAKRDWSLHGQCRPVLPEMYVVVSIGGLVPRSGSFDLGVERGAGSFPSMLCMRNGSPPRPARSCTASQPRSPSGSAVAPPPTDTSRPSASARGGAWTGPRPS